MKKFLVLAASLFAMPAAFANPMGEVSFYLTSLELDVQGLGKDDDTGFGVHGWWAINGPVFVHGEYQTVELGSGGAKFDVESLRLGGGFFHEASKQMGLFAKGEFVDFGSDLDQDGFGFHGGAVFHPGPAVSLMGSLGYLTTDDTDGLELNVGGGYSFNKQWGAFVDYRTYMAEDDRTKGDVDVSELRAGVSFMFGSM